MSCRWLQRSWTRSQWRAVSEKPWSGVRVYPHTIPLTFKKMELIETIGVTLKDGVWCWATDLTVVAEVVCGLSTACVFIRTLYPC